MQSRSTQGMERISSGSTQFWKSYFPPIWTAGVGAGMLGVCFEWFGNPVSMELKLLGLTVWAGTSILFKLGTRKLREVWIADDQLIVSSEGQKVRIPLREVTEIRETRGQKLKRIRLRIRGVSRADSDVFFIPVHRAHVPFTDHPVVRLLRDRQMEIAAGDEDRARLL